MATALFVIPRDYLFGHRPKNLMFSSIILGLEKSEILSQKGRILPILLIRPSTARPVFLS
jgi:hypothetical protein